MAEKPDKNRRRTRKPPLHSPEELVRWAGTRDPFVIAQKLGIPVHHLYHPESALPGLTCLCGSRPSIFINDAYFEEAGRRNRAYTEQDAKDDMDQIGAHELGHACLHRKQLKSAPIYEYEIFDVRSSMEVEANKFAAAIRIDRDEMLELLNSEYDILQVASAIHVNVNLLIYRIEMLRREGMLFNEAPYAPKNSFIGHIAGAGSSEWGSLPVHGSGIHADMII